MIDEGTDGLSRGMWLAPERLMQSSIMESSMALGGVPFSEELGKWALEAVGYSRNSKYELHTTLGKWDFKDIYGKLSIWVPVPEIARQAIVQFLNIWVEGAITTSGIFIVPCVIQKEWEYLSKHVITVGETYPCTLPPECTYYSQIPFVLLYVPFYVRALPSTRLDKYPPTPAHPRWHEEQAEHVRGL
jgi:hypothetical protein